MSGDRLDRKVLAAVERLGRALRAARQAAATRHDLSLLGVAIVQLLATGGDRRVGDLAAELDVSQPTVSDAVSALERRRLVARQRDPHDRRSTRVVLTDEGVALGSDIERELGPLFEVEAGNRTDRATTLRVLLGEIHRLQRGGVITVNRSCLSCHHHRPRRATESARCLLLGTDLPDADLRVDCPEHRAADH